MYERAGPPWDTRCTPPVYTGYSIRRVYMRACVHTHHKWGDRAGTQCTRSHGGLTVGRGAPSRELVLQLLTGLSHPAREKDHLARRAIYLTIPPHGSSDSSLFSLSFCCPSLGAQSSVPTRFPSLPSTRACRTRGRSPSSPRGTPRTRFGNCTRFAASSYPPYRGTFLRKAPPACFLKSPLFRRTLFIPLLCFSWGNDGPAWCTRIPLPEVPPILLMSSRWRAGPAGAGRWHQPKRLGIEIRFGTDCSGFFRSMRTKGSVHPRKPFFVFHRMDFLKIFLTGQRILKVLCLRKN